MRSTSSATKKLSLDRLDVTPGQAEARNSKSETNSNDQNPNDQNALENASPDAKIPRGSIAIFCEIGCAAATCRGEKTEKGLSC